MASLPVAPTMGTIRALVTELEALGVSLPREVAQAQAAHERITAPESYAAGVALTNPDDLGPEQIIRWTVLRTMSEAVKDTQTHASDALAANAAAHLSAAADDLIDQMRPAFDTAAEAFNAARKAGVTEHTTAGNLLDMPPKAVTAWRALAEHVPTLAQIASARVGMSRTLGIAPDEWPSSTTYAACFANAGAGWNGNVSHPATWLRLAASGLTLNHVAETEDLTRVVRTPVVIDYSGVEARVS